MGVYKTLQLKQGVLRIIYSDAGEQIPVIVANSGDR